MLYRIFSRCLSTQNRILPSEFLKLEQPTLSWNYLNDKSKNRVITATTSGSLITAFGMSNMITIEDIDWSSIDFPLFGLSGVALFGVWLSYNLGIRSTKEALYIDLFSDARKLSKNIIDIQTNPIFKYSQVYTNSQQLQNDINNMNYSIVHAFNNLQQIGDRLISYKEEEEKLVKSYDQLVNKVDKSIVYPLPSFQLDSMISNIQKVTTDIQLLPDWKIEYLTYLCEMANANAIAARHAANNALNAANSARRTARGVAVLGTSMGIAAAAKTLYNRRR